MRLRIIRQSVVFLLTSISSPLLAQTSLLPATPDTAATPASTTVPRPHRAEVTFSAGLLTVSATNASLNQLLRETARQTGMHISGSVAEDRVFGTYGPARPSAVLSILLDGTGSNILLLDATSTAPARLVLTPRTGSASPPNPNARNQSDQDADSDTFLSSQPSPQVRRPSAPTASQPVVEGQTTSTTQPVIFPPIGTTTVPAASTTTPANPDDPAANGPKTPQQIFEQLQRLRQQATPQR